MGVPLLLYVQPLVKVVTFSTSIFSDDAGMTISLGRKPTDVPEPLAGMLRTHLAARPDLRTGKGLASPWLFPGYLAGRHVDPSIVMDGLRNLGINRRGARNRAIGELVLECPPLSSPNTRIQPPSRLPPRQECRTMGSLRRTSNCVPVRSRRWTIWLITNEGVVGV